MSSKVSTGGTTGGTTPEEVVVVEEVEEEAGVDASTGMLECRMFVL
jgi:hypothetical protein